MHNNIYIALLILQLFIITLFKIVECLVHKYCIVNISYKRSL